MKRMKPEQKADNIGDLNLRTEKSVGDYLTSVNQSAYFVKPPNWDTLSESIELLLIKSKQEHDSMMKLQCEMRDNIKRQNLANAERTQHLYKIQESLRKQLIEVNNFIKECADKKRVAGKVVNEQFHMHKEIHKKLSECRGSLAELSAFRDLIKDTVNDYEPYDRVLTEVTKKSQIFTSTQDCIGRCDALMLAQLEIRKLDALKMNEIENMRNRMIQLTNDAAFSILGMKNKLAKLERSYATAMSNCHKWEKILANSKNVLANYSLEKSRTFDAIMNLSKVLSKRRDIDLDLHGDSILRATEFIKTEFEIITEVLNEMKSDNTDSKVDGDENNGC